jgi:hypothetical protein
MDKPQETLLLVCHYRLVEFVSHKVVQLGFAMAILGEFHTRKCVALDQVPIAKEDSYVDKSKHGLIRTALG